MEVDGVSGAARRRKERRLRAWLRHERQSVAAAVAEALHHSAGPREKVVERLVRQEGEVNEQYSALRRPTTPLPGTRPAPLAEVAGPQAAVTDGYVAASGPLLGAPLLADSSAEAIDGSTLSFLLQVALEDKRKEEEEAVETAVLVKMEADVAAAERHLLEVVAKSTIPYFSGSSVEVAAVRWFLAKDAVGKRKAKRRRKRKKRMRRWRRPRSS